MEYDETAAAGEFDEYQRYEPGIRCFPDPAQQEYRHMVHLVAYDICQPRRLRRVARVCEDFGLRIEKSVFECDLSAEYFARFWARLLAEIEPAEDAVVAYRLCGTCVRRIESLGQVYRPGRRLCYIL